MAFLQSYISVNSLGTHHARAHALPPPQPIPDPPKGSDNFAQQLLTAAQTLLSTLSNSDRHATALLLGTHHGSLAIDRLFNQSRIPNPRYASPAAFTHTLPSSLPAELAIKLSLRGPSLTLSADAASGPLALARAIHWIDSHRAPYCLTGEFDFPTPAQSHFTLCLLSFQSPALATLTAKISPPISPLPLPHPSAPITNLPTLLHSQKNLHLSQPNTTINIYYSNPNPNP